MHNFEKRRDRYDLFASFEKPLVNLSFELPMPDFRPYCKANGLPPFHFFLYCVLNAVKGIDNFMYRVLDGEVIKLDDFAASYTVINHNNDLNITKFEMTDDLPTFIARSLAAKQVAEARTELANMGPLMTPLEQKQNVHITCMPWFKLTSVEHPIYRHADYDIPSLAWGRFGDAQADGMMMVPFSVQAHHGFVDGYHVHLLTQSIAARARNLMAQQESSAR